jgi:hypothetical protein
MWEWRNQNQLDYPIIVRRIWKKRSTQTLAIPIAWQPFPNEKQASQAGLAYCYSAHDQAAFDKDSRLTGHAPAPLYLP